MADDGLDAPQEQLVGPSACARRVFIYTLSDPRTGQVRYVGKALNLKARLRQHIRQRTDQRMTPRSAWLISLSRAGLEPVMAVLEECSEDAWADRERHHIAALRAAGANLTNLADGGNEPSCDRATRSRNAKRTNKHPDWPIWQLTAAFARQENKLAKEGRHDAAAKFSAVASMLRNSTGKVRDRLRVFARSRIDG